MYACNSIFSVWIKFISLKEEQKIQNPNIMPFAECGIKFLDCFFSNGFPYKLEGFFFII